MKNIYTTLDTETFGGAAHPKGIYHLAGIIHHRSGKILGTYNILIAEHYHEIEKDSYAKKNFHKYEEMVASGQVTMVATEREAIELVKKLLEFYGVTHCMAFNSGFDFTKTMCRELLENREFVDLWLMACETLATKKYRQYCMDNGFLSPSKKNCKSSAESFYSYLTQNPNYEEEHTAFEDVLIEKAIFEACVKTHKKFTRNIHFFDHPNKYSLYPKLV